jgi:hypothetical protein
MSVSPTIVILTVALMVSVYQAREARVELRLYQDGLIDCRKEQIETQKGKVI